MKRLLLIIPVIFFLIISQGCAALQTIGGRTAEEFGNEVIKIVGPAVEQKLVDVTQNLANDKFSKDRAGLLSGANKVGIDHKLFDYDGDGQIDIGDEFYDLQLAVKDEAASSGIPLTAEETGGLLATAASLALAFLVNRRRKTDSKIADTTIRGVKSFRKKSEKAILKSGVDGSLSDARVEYEGEMYNVDEFVRSVLREEAEDAGIQAELHERVKRVAT